MNAITVQLPQDLQLALAPYSEVRAIFEQLPPRHLQLYIGWIREARQPELRAQRIAQTIHRLLENAA
jgi:uncharacterized protein YdeI (YjbR/CyaY-like superfamily)